MAEKLMKAVEIKAFGGPEMLQLCQRSRPTPGPGQILIKVAYAGVNRSLYSAKVITQYQKMPMTCPVWKCRARLSRQAMGKKLANRGQGVRAMPGGI